MSYCEVCKHNHEGTGCPSYNRKAYPIILGPTGLGRPTLEDQVKALQAENDHLKKELEAARDTITKAVNVLSMGAYNQGTGSL